MRLFKYIAAAALVSGVATAEERSPTKLISDALLPLPTELREGTKVVVVDEPGTRRVLREGNNGIICQADSPDPDFDVRCYHQSLDAFFTRLAELQAGGASLDTVLDTLHTEMEAGKLKSIDRATVYRLRGSNLEGALPHTAVFLPGATSQSTGLPTEPSHYRPWLMWSGTAAAHIMIPGK